MTRILPNSAIVIGHRPSGIEDLPLPATGDHKTAAGDKRPGVNPEDREQKRQGSE
ncbi:MAG: hypothetical protein JRH12_08510 [Deltaproteobacteria bacterium]|jgi:hypothetical protein|nr:hypothetical protein [Deltaproteobacteria bacterium]MBW2480518.1 hypothetical protein [Deltaproteobacteria bacterium]